MNPLNCCGRKKIPDIEIDSEIICCNQSNCNILCCFPQRSRPITPLDQSVDKISNGIIKKPPKNRGLQT